MENEATFSPPYNIPWATFLSTVEKIGADLPNRVDRHYLDSRSGSEQSYLIAALRGFGLINEDKTTSKELRELAQAGDERPAKVAELLCRFYPDAVKRGESNTTMGELEEAFAEAFPRITGASRTKAIRFFLNAMEYAQLPKSPLWKAAKVPGSTRKSTGSRRGRGSGARNGTGTGDNTPQQKPRSTDEERKQAYFELLLEKAKTAEDNDILDRIEKLLGERKATE